MRKEHGGKDPITQLVMTNHPSHYTKDREIPQHAHMLVQASLLSVKPARMEALMAITHATNVYGSIPRELPPSLTSLFSISFRPQGGGWSGHTRFLAVLSLPVLVTLLPPHRSPITSLP
jgi:hypothetical protein